MDKKLLSKRIKDFALEIGFDACGIAKVEDLSKERSILNQWLAKQYHGDMAYMARNIEKRTNPSELIGGAQSVISVLLNYYPAKNLHKNSFYKISKYALSADYHYVIKEKLKPIIELLEEVKPGVNIRAFTDSAPVLDKSWAQRAGLGWMGKNSLLINKNLGSFFFIGEIIVDIDLVADSAFEQEYCGTCTKCIDACPTDALHKPYEMDANKCISYLTIETKKEIPEDIIPKLNNWVYGCDICQDVCPWNSKAKPSTEPYFKISDELSIMQKQDWEDLDKPKFKKLFKNSALQRGGFKKLKSVINDIHNSKCSTDESVN